MTQFHDHHAEDYEDYEGSPDGKDLYDAHMEGLATLQSVNNIDTLAMELLVVRQMFPALEKKIFDALETVEFQLSCRMDRLQEDIYTNGDALVKHLCLHPDDFDTQKQVEELNEYDDIEKYAENWQGIETVVAIQTDDGKQAEIKFPSLESALKFCGPNVNTKGK